MKKILEQIVAYKREEVKLNKTQFPLITLENNLNFSREVYSLKKALENPATTGIIAEFKRKSPSKGIINSTADVAKTTKGYIKAGASALSVLTDEYFFGGKTNDLIAARNVNNCPILRKDFIIDEYQVIETKAMGADVILLIAAVLSAEETRNLAALAKQAGLEVLLEIHSADELDNLNEFVDVVGVNNRNLNDFNVSINRSLELFDVIPLGTIKISESGIDSHEKLITLKQKGFQGFLMGERFMMEDKPEKACKEFIHRVKMNSTLITKL